MNSPLGTVPRLAYLVLLILFFTLLRHLLLLLHPMMMMLFLGDAMVENGGIKQKNVAVQAKNRRVLNDIGNLVTIRDVEGKVQRRITRSFGAKLLANAQVAVENNNKVVAPAGGARAVPKPPTKKVVTAKLEPEIIVISPDTEEVKHKEEKKVVQNEKSIAKKNKKLASMTAVLTARSKEEV